MDREDTLIIPRHLVTLRFIDIPSLDKAEIEKMAEFQALKEIPYAKEEMITGLRNLGSFKEGITSIMLVIARRELILQKIEAREKQGFKVEGINLFTEQLYLSLLNRRILPSNRVALVIHIGKDSSEIMVVDKTRPVFSRGFINSDRFFDEVDTSLLVYKRIKTNPEIEDIIVTHASYLDIEDIKPLVMKLFGTGVIFDEYGDDLRKIQVIPEIDLLPKEFSEKSVRLKRRYETLFSYSLIGLILILSSVFLYFRIYEKNKLLKLVSSRLLQIQSKIEPIEGYSKKTLILKQHEEKGVFIIEVLKETFSLIPSGISITGLRYDGKENIFYNGTTRGSSLVFNFVKKIEESGYFEKVEIKSTAKKKVKGEELTDFSIQCRIKGPL